MIDKELLNILACPVCKTEVSQDGDFIVCSKCGRRYPIKDDIPVMLADEAPPFLKKERDEAIMPDKGR